MKSHVVMLVSICLEHRNTYEHTKKGGLVCLCSCFDVDRYKQVKLTGEVFLTRFCGFILFLFLPFFTSEITILSSDYMT